MNDLVKIENGKLQLSDDYVEKYKMLYRLDKETELSKKMVNQKVKDYMEENNIENLSANGLFFTLRKGTMRTTLDSKALKEKMPDVYDEFSKTSEVASSLIVKVLD